MWRMFERMIRPGKIASMQAYIEAYGRRKVGKNGDLHEGFLER